MKDEISQLEEKLASLKEKNQLERRELDEIKIYQDQLDKDYR